MFLQACLTNGRKILSVTLSDEQNLIVSQFFRQLKEIVTTNKKYQSAGMDLFINKWELDYHRHH